MVSILIVDDSSTKIKSMRALLDGIPEIESYEVCQDIINAKRQLSKNHYDLLILDLNLPLRAGDDPKPQNGIDFLEETNRSKRLSKPFHIIGLTAFDNFLNEFSTRFQNDLWALIKYDETSNSWERQIKSKVEYLIQSKKSLQGSIKKTYNYDVAIVTALQAPELKSVLELPGSWQSFKSENDSTEFFKGVFNNGEKRIKVVTAAAPQMGMVASSVLAMKLIELFRPKFLVMCGIAAGIEGNPGDILITDISFDSGSGKITTDSDGDAKFFPDYRSVDLDTDLKETFLSCKAKREFLDEIKRKWAGDVPDAELSIRMGPLASGAGVIENSKIVNEIKGHSRKLIGIDMETYGVFYAAKHCTKPRPLAAFALKSISDYADPLKNDKFQKYAAYTSASFMYRFITEKLEFDFADSSTVTD